jgi:hypothetical protein
MWSRYLPFGRSQPDRPDDNVSEPIESVQAASTRNQSDAGTELTTYRRGQNQDVSTVPARVIGFGSPRDEAEVDEFMEYYEEEESPSPSAVAMVRLCVWSFFLFGFLFMFQAQERLNSERTRQTSKFRSSQLVQFPVPWGHQSGFSDHSAAFSSFLISSDPETLSVRKLGLVDKTVTIRRLGMSNNTVEDSEITGESYLSIRRGDDLVPITRSGADQFQIEINTSKLELKIKGSEIVFFQFLKEDMVAVTRPSSGTNVDYDCIQTYLISDGSCKTSHPVQRAQGYYYDEVQSVVVTVGVDSISKDSGGNNMRGVFVRSIKPGDGKVDSSISIPFLHRYEEGVWSFQNAPLTNGFIVLLPLMGYPPMPIQHVVAIREGTQDFPKGSVFRLESDSVSLWRKVDVLKFNPPDIKDSICSC